LDSRRFQSFFISSAPLLPLVSGKLRLSRLPLGFDRLLLRGGGLAARCSCGLPETSHCGFNFIALLLRHGDGLGQTGFELLLRPSRSGHLRLQVSGSLHARQCRDGQRSCALHERTRFSWQPGRRRWRFPILLIATVGAGLVRIRDLRGRYSRLDGSTAQRRRSRGPGRGRLRISKQRRLLAGRDNKSCASVLSHCCRWYIATLLLLLLLLCWAFGGGQHRGRWSRRCRARGRRSMW